jgi:hypothetical protein
MAVVAIVALWVGGCALQTFTPPPGTSDLQAKQDHDLCARDNQAYRYVSDIGNTKINRSLYQQCLEFLGYKEGPY